MTILRRLRIDRSNREKYYNWTDAQTEAPDDGRALFGRDAMANYLLIGAKELGCTIFDVQNGKMTLILIKCYP